jgi:uncharacterized protein YjbI with pentapeptide repeats
LLGANLTGANFTQANLTQAAFSGSVGIGSSIPAATLTGANFSQANLTNADFGGYTGNDGEGNYDYFGADLTGASLVQANLTGANFRLAALTNADLSHTTLNANFISATLTGANLTGADVRGTSFNREFLEHPHNIFAGSGITLAQLYSTASYQARDLTGIGLGRNNLADAYLVNQNLASANFSGATLTGANLAGAEIQNANFNRAYLSYYPSILAGGLTLPQLYSTASYLARDLNGVGLAGNNLTGADLAGQNLMNAGFAGATLTGTNLTGAEVRGANLGDTGITAAQLSSTASYLAHDLTGIGLFYNNLTDWNLAGQNLTNADFRFAALTNADFRQANLTNASFRGATLTNADFRQANLTNAKFDFNGTDLTGANLSQANLTNADFSGYTDYLEGDQPGANLTGANLSGADARGANFYLATLDDAITSNLIQSDGHIAGLDLTSGASLVVRDYDENPAVYPPTGPLPIVVEQHLAMDATGTLRLVFDADPWDSLISFAPGIPVTLGGTLELDFATGVDVATQSGRTIDLFDWTGVTPTGAFTTVSSPYTWNLTNLYTTGEVTLTAAPGFPGDFNNNGSVDAADYVVWRKNNGTPAAYNIWRANFGAVSPGIGAGSGAALPSAAPLSAAVPEPATLALLALGLLLLAWRNSRQLRTYGTRGALGPMTVLWKL